MEVLKVGDTACRQYEFEIYQLTWLANQERDLCVILPWAYFLFYSAKFATLIDTIILLTCRM